MLQGVIGQPGKDILFRGLYGFIHGLSFSDYLVSFYDFGDKSTHPKNKNNEFLN